MKILRTATGMDRRQLTNHLSVMPDNCLVNNVFCHVIILELNPAYVKDKIGSKPCVRLMVITAYFIKNQRLHWRQIDELTDYGYNLEQNNPTPTIQ